MIPGGLGRSAGLVFHKTKTSSIGPGSFHVTHGEPYTLGCNKNKFSRNWSEGEGEREEGEWCA